MPYTHGATGGRRLTNIDVLADAAQIGRKNARQVLRAESQLSPLRAELRSGP